MSLLRHYATNTQHQLDIYAAIIHAATLKLINTTKTTARLMNVMLRFAFYAASIMHALCLIYARAG